MPLVVQSDGTTAQATFQQFLPAFADALLMSRTWPRLRRVFALSLLSCAAASSLSCSHSDEKSAAALEAAEILELVNEGQNDPRSDVEIDLGTFRVTHAVGRDDEILLLVDFQLYGVLSQHKQVALDAALPGYSNRVRDAIISLVQSIDTEHLTDPSLAFLKSEIIASINRVLQQRLVKDVVFSNFSVHDAHNAPFPTTTSGPPPKKKSSGHGGHGH
jgi:flagellar basal body-associated protein FliL